ncbi:MAG: hypothetical protein ACT4PM_13980 [Gemmatimonadales bacterium]
MFCWRIAAGCALAATACGAEAPTGPALPRLTPGFYVLEEIGGVPAPYVYERVRYGDTLIATLQFAFDSVQILNDTTFTRHYRRELLVERPPVPPFVQGTEEFSFSGIILDREEEVKLTVRSGPLPGGHDLAYFVPDDSGLVLLRRTVRREVYCAASCELTERRVNARYARR